MSYTPYTPQSWNASSYVTPTGMNHIEAGIKSNSDGISSLNTDLSNRYTKTESDTKFAQKGEIVVDEDATITNTFSKVKTISMPNTPKLVYASMQYNASQPVSIGLIQIIGGYNYLVGYTERHATSDFQGTSSVTVAVVTSAPTLDIYASGVNTSGVNKITYGYIPLT